MNDEQTKNNKGRQVKLKDLTYHEVKRSTVSELEARMDDLKKAVTPQQLAEMRGDLAVCNDEYAEALQHYQAAGDLARVKEKRGCCYADLAKTDEAIVELRAVEPELSFWGISKLVRSLHRKKGFVADVELEAIAVKLLDMPGIDCALPFTTAADVVAQGDPVKKIAIYEVGNERLGGSSLLEGYITDIQLNHRIGEPRDIYARLANGEHNQDTEFKLYRAALLMEDMDLAIQHLDALIEADATKIKYLAQKAACLIEAGRLSEADEFIAREEALSPITETYETTSWESWEPSFSAGRLRILAAIKGDDEIKLAQEVGAFARVIQAHPEEVLTNATHVIEGYYQTPRMSLLPERQRISEAAVKPEARGVMALLWYLYDLDQRVSGDAVELEQLAGKISPPLLRHVAEALAASAAQKWRTAGEQITLAEIENLKGTTGITLPSILDDDKWKNLTAPGQIIKGFCAVIEALPAKDAELYGYGAFSLFRDHLAEHNQSNIMLTATRALITAGVDNAAVHFDLGWALHGSDREMAARNYRKVLEAEPHHYAALNNLHLLARGQADLTELHAIRARAQEASELDSGDDKWAKLLADCDAAIDQGHIKQHALTDLRQRLDAVVASNKDKRVDYAGLPDDIALILIALDRTLGARTFERRFFRSECSSLAPVWSGMFLTRLYEAQVIADDPQASKADAYFLRDGGLIHYLDKTAYFVVSDRHARNPQDGIMILTGRQFGDAGALHPLWLDYAETECMAYLYGMLSKNSLQMADEAVREIRATLRQALRQYSIAEMWSVIWKIVRDAEALAQRDYYNGKKAAATLPGKLSRHLEKVSKGEGLLKPWDRPHDQPAGTLGQVFFEYFLIDETTPGKKVGAMLEREPPPEQGAFIIIDEAMKARVNELFKRVVRKNEAAVLLAQFTQKLRNGATFEEAVDQMEKNYPASKAKSGQ